MTPQNKPPKTLQEAVIYFSDIQNAIDFVAALRWSEGATCPHCQSKENYYLPPRKIWRCKNKACKKDFSVKVGTIFEDSPIKLDKWLCAIWMIVNAKNGISSYEIHRALGVTQKSAWFMMHRIRLALQEGSFELMQGEVEVDETYIGGKVKNMHKAKIEAREKQGRGAVNKTVVMGLLERNGQVRTKVIRRANKKTLQGEIRRNVVEGSTVYTDEFTSYQGLQNLYAHQVIEHATAYVRGNVHTNGIENYWSLFKRALRGTYVNCGNPHLFRYLDEQTFRFNNRGTTDMVRFTLALSGITGKRITYDQLTANETFKQLRLWKRLS
jgi:transposase-like protein